MPVAQARGVLDHIERRLNGTLHTHNLEPAASTCNATCCQPEADFPSAASASAGGPKRGTTAELLAVHVMTPQGAGLRRRDVHTSIKEHMK